MRETQRSDRHTDSKPSTKLFFGMPLPDTKIVVAADETGTVAINLKR